MNPLVLVILDGWGLSPLQDGNATLLSPTPNFDQLMSYFPHASLGASGESVGLAWGEIGNSEVGHLNLGNGRIIMQDLPRIDQTISEGSFFKNKELIDAFESAKQNNTNVHLIGLTSAGGVHSHINHLYALLDMAQKSNFSRVYIHMITDGRDTPPKSALNDLSELKEKCSQTGIGIISTVMGRFFAMDRDNRWERIQQAYDALTVENYINKSKSAEEAINEAYKKEKTDEFIEPVVIENTPRIKDKDSIIFFNFRADRSKQISESIINPEFNGFKRSVILKDFYFVSFTSYGNEPSPSVKVAFFAQKTNSPLAQIISDNNLTQLHIAETEKYAHVTYFFNSGIEKEFPGEHRIMIASPKVETYDLAPKMSVEQITSQFISFFNSAKQNFTVLNIANPDMVGHTGNLEATKQAISITDACLGKISNVVLSAGGNLIVTADHGNAEQMLTDEGEINKEHTTNPVPLILATSERRNQNPIPVDINYKITLASKSPVGVLADVTATCVDEMGLEKNAKITGQSLRTVI